MDPIPLLVGMILFFVMFLIVLWLWMGARSKLDTARLEASSWEGTCRAHENTIERLTDRVQVERNIVHRYQRLVEEYLVTQSDLKSDFEDLTEGLVPF